MERWSATLREPQGHPSKVEGRRLCCPAKPSFAWLAHLYTAMGFVCAAGIAVLIVRGGDESFRWAFLLMMIATAIDATDGWLARRARVKEVLPHFDGAALDNLIDFHTYASLPLLLLVAGGRPARRCRMAPASATARQRLRVLAGQRQDG